MTRSAKLLRMPAELKRQIDIAADALDMDACQFLRHAAREKLERDFTPSQLNKIRRRAEKQPA